MNKLFTLLIIFRFTTLIGITIGLKILLKDAIDRKLKGFYPTVLFISIIGNILLFILVVLDFFQII